jgi:transposase-like protein
MKCNMYSVNRKGFENYRHSPEVITVALDLRAKGVSLSDVVDHLDQHHRVQVTRKTVLFWQRNFGEKLKSFSQTLTPHLGGTFHADEMFVKQRKNWIYYWDCLDYETKFLVADHLSDDRNDQEAVKFLNKIKCGSPELPAIVHMIIRPLLGKYFHVVRYIKRLLHGNISSKIILSNGFIIH